MAVSHPAAPTVGEPETSEATDIGLVHRRQMVTVGQSSEAAYKVFQDTHESGFETDQLPPGFAEPYQARSWEDGQHGFGVILFHNRVVAAMYQEENGSLDHLRDMVNTHSTHLADVTPLVITGKKVNYYFWEKDRQRLMICGFETQPGTIKITECMGDHRVLDALDINFAKAQQTAKLVDASPTKPDLAPVGSAK